MKNVNSLTPADFFFNIEFYKVMRKLCKNKIATKQNILQFLLSSLTSFLPGIKQTWNLSKSLLRPGFLGANFTRKSVNYDKSPIATKQRKISLNNEIFTFGVFTLDNLIPVILPR